MPDPEGTGAQHSAVDGAQQVATDPKQIQHDAVHRQEPLPVRRANALAAVATGVLGRYGGTTRFTTSSTC